SLRIGERARVLWHSVGQYQTGISRDPIDGISRAKSLRVSVNESGPPGWINAYTRKQESTGVRGSFREAKRRLSRLDQVRFRRPTAYIRWSLRRQRAPDKLSCKTALLAPQEPWFPRNSRVWLRSRHCNSFLR